MITKITLTDSYGNIYELPHKNLKLSAYAFSKATSLEISVVSRDLFVEQGNTLSLYINGNLYFLGKIFEFSSDYNEISITAYDNLLYFKSKDTILVKNTTASTLLKEVCAKIGLHTGSIIDTSYCLPYTLYENTSYFDIFSSILDSTSQISAKNYVLSDKLGYITLVEQNCYSKTIEVDEKFLLSTYSHTSAQDTCNVVHVYQISETGEISSFYAYNEQSISKIGKIQKSLNVDRNLSTAQCNLIAQNTLQENENTSFYLEISIIALEIVNIYDILQMNGGYYQVLESILNISGSSETYSLLLERVVN
ncbi:MAG: hypothetical protein R3Y09_10975 [Clostridia bacterium]